MKLFRKDVNMMFDTHWCIICGKVTDMTPVKTGMPGIFAQKCGTCNSHYMENGLEEDDDIITIPDDAKVPEGVKSAV